MSVFPQRWTLQCRNLQNYTKMPLDAYKQRRTRVMMPDMWRLDRATISRFWLRYKNTASNQNKQEVIIVRPTESEHPSPSSIYPVDAASGWFRAATSTANQIPGPRRISSQPVISRLRQAGVQASRTVRSNVLTAHHLEHDFGGVKNIVDGDVHSGDQLSSLTNIASCC